MSQSEAVNHPPHYTNHPSGVECIEITEHMSFNLGNVVKYVWRVDGKGVPIEDLEKAAWYLAREIARRKGEDREAGVPHPHANPMPVALEMEAQSFASSKPSVVSDVELEKRLDLSPMFIGVDLARKDTSGAFNDAEIFKGRKPAPIGGSAIAVDDEGDRTPPAPQTPEPAAPTAAFDLITGPISEAEAEQIIILVKQGVGPVEIGRRLSRDKKSITNWKYRNQDRILAARKGVAKTAEKLAVQPVAKEKNTGLKRPVGVSAPPASREGQAAPAVQDGSIQYDHPVRANLPVPARPIFDHVVRQKSKDWTRAMDLALATELAAGNGVDGAVCATGLPRDDVLMRWKALNTNRGDLEHQTNLIAVLKALAEQPKD